MKKFSYTLLLVWAEALWSLPVYTAREGRICDNCHANPFQTDRQQEWPNPELSKRKCNLSCSTCHIDTNGGGMRRVAGRYLNASTLPYWLNYERRPYWDYLRNLSGTIKRIGDSLFPPPNKPKPLSAAEWEKQQAELKKKAQNLPTHDRTHFLPPFWSIRDPFAFGHALNARGDERTYSPYLEFMDISMPIPFCLFRGISGRFTLRLPKKKYFSLCRGSLQLPYILWSILL